MTLAELRDRLVADECGKHEEVLMLITACIVGGTNQGTAIASKLAELGFNRQHVGLQLQLHTGSNPERHRWFKDDTGRYRLLT